MEHNIPDSSQKPSQPLGILKQANLQQELSALDLVADWLSKQQESTSTAQCSSLATDIGRALIIAEDCDGSLMDSVSYRAAERDEPIQAERSGTPTPEETWFDDADVQCLEIRARKENSRPHNVQGMAGMVIDVLRDYYSIGPDATRQKACYDPFYGYLENNQTGSTLPANFQFKQDDYLKMFVHEDVLVPEQSEYNGRGVLEESLLWPKHPGLVIPEDIDVENRDPNIAGSHSSRELEDPISEPNPKYKRIESSSGRYDKPQALDSVSSPSDRVAVWPVEVIQDRETGHTTNQPIFTSSAKPVSLDKGERISGPSRLAPASTDLRHKLNAKMASGTAQQKAPGTGNISFGSQANEPILRFPGGCENSSTHQNFTSYQQTASSTILSDSSTHQNFTSYQQAASSTILSDSSTHQNFTSYQQTASSTILSDSSSDEDGRGRCRRRFLRTELSNPKLRRRLFSLSKGFSSQESLEYATPLRPESPTPPKPPVKFQKEKILDEWGEDLDYELSSDDEEDVPVADGPPTHPGSRNKASEEPASVDGGQSDVKKLSQKFYHQRI